MLAIPRPLILWTTYGGSPKHPSSSNFEVFRPFGSNSFEWKPQQSEEVRAVHKFFFFGRLYSLSYLVYSIFWCAFACWKRLKKKSKGIFSYSHSLKFWRKLKGSLFYVRSFTLINILTLRWFCAEVRTEYWKSRLHFGEYFVLVEIVLEILQRWN